MKYVADAKGEAELLKLPALGQVLEQRVQAAARRAAELAPDDPHTGAPDLHTSVYGDVALMGPGYRGRVGAEDYKAAWFEKGAKGVPPRPFLEPAVEQEIGPLGPDLGAEG